MAHKEWQELTAWMYSQEVQAVVAKYEPKAEEQQGEPQQAALWEEANDERCTTY